MAIRGWIFQGNPKIFDIDDYLSRYPLIYWRTPKHKNSIAIGDRAFMWRAGDTSGIIASGKVVELPVPASQVNHPEALGSDLWRAKQDPFVDDQIDHTVGIMLDSVRLVAEEGMISRSAFKDDPLLAQSSIIRQANATVFSLTSDEAARIEELWGGTIFQSVESFEISAEEGDKKIYAHRKRERSRFLVRKKMEQARRSGTVQCEICGLSESGIYPQSYGIKVFEVHHIMPLSETETPKRTTLDDLAVVCANCHRAVHSTSQVEENFHALKRTFRGKD